MLTRAFKHIFQGCFRFQLGRRITRAIQRQVNSSFDEIFDGNYSLRFSSVSKGAQWRSQTLLKKEPDTLNFIDAIPSGATFWDIGASTGIYTIYAAKRGITAIAFEPHPLNTEILARNVALNNVSQNATICPFALSNSTSLGTLSIPTLEGGASNNQFGINDSGSSFLYPTIAFSIDDLIALGFPVPLFIKLDVDGLEAAILGGAEKTLKFVQQILIENPPELGQHAEIHAMLNRAGLHHVTTTRVNELWKRFES